MSPTDVDTIADTVVRSLIGLNPGLLGCGAISSTLAHADSGEGPLSCTNYECGGMAIYTCSQSFSCHSYTDY